MKAYDSDRLDAELTARGVEMIVPHHPKRRTRTQDGRAASGAIVDIATLGAGACDAPSLHLEILMSWNVDGVPGCGL